MDQGLRLLLWPGLAATVGLVILFTLVPWSADGPLWGLFFVTEYSLPARLLFAVVPVATTLALAAPWRRFLTLEERPAPRGVRALGSALVLVVLSFLLFWLLRERRFYGDATFTIAILEGRVPVQPLGTYYWKEPLDRLIAYDAYLRLNAWLGWGAAQSVALVSALAGAATVAVLIREARLVGANRYERFFLAAFPLSAGASQLFFGHVENYTLVTLGVVAFLAAARSYVDGRAPLLAPVTIAAVAVTLHGLAAFLLFPVLALPSLRSGERPGPRQVAELARAAIPGLVYLVGFYAFSRWLGADPLRLGVNSFADDGHVFLSPLQAIAPRHLADLAQLCLLVLPVGAALLIVRPERLGASPPDPRLRLLAITTLAFFAYVLFFDAKNGTLQDWDLLAAPAIPLGLWAARLHTLDVRARPAERIVGLLALSVSAAVTLPWIWSNARP